MLFRPTEQFGKLSPDQETVFFLFDRVVNVQNGSVVPVGMRGSVIGIHEGTAKYYKVLLFDLSEFFADPLHFKGRGRRQLDLREIHFHSYLYIYMHTYYKPLQICDFWKWILFFVKIGVSRTRPNMYNKAFLTKIAYC